MPGKRAKRRGASRHAAWQASWARDNSLVRLTIVRWLGDDQKLGWGREGAKVAADPFPGEVVVKIFECDASKPSRSGDRGKEKGADDPIATCRGTFKRLASRPKGAMFVPSSVQAQTADGKLLEIKPGKPPAGSPLASTPDFVWVHFEGTPREQLYKLRIPTEPGEREGDYFEIGFSIERDGKEEFRTRAPISRRRGRGALLAVEPLCQDWYGATLERKNARHRSLIETFHQGDWETADRGWWRAIYRYDRGRNAPARFGRSGCSVISFTMVARYLGAYDQFIKGFDFDTKYAPFSALGKMKLATETKRWVFDSKGYGQEPIPVPTHWWPVWLVWFARQKGGCYEVGVGKEPYHKLTAHYERGRAAFDGFISESGRTLWSSPALLEALQLKQLWKLSVTRAAWPKQREQLMKTLDRGLPAMALVSKGSLGHWMVIVGYVMERGKPRFIWNDPGSSKLRYLAPGKPGEIPHWSEKLKLPLVTLWALVPVDAHKAERWDTKKDARFLSAPELGRKPAAKVAPPPSGDAPQYPMEDGRS